MTSLSDYVTAARSSWPQRCVAEQDFARFVLERSVGERIPSVAHAGDLLLASRDIRVKFQNERRELGLPRVDDRWRAVKEFVIGSDGLVRRTSEPIELPMAA